MVYLLDDNLAQRKLFEISCEIAEVPCLTFATPENLIAGIFNEKPTICFIDIFLDSGESGNDVADLLSEQYPDILLIAYATLLRGCSESFTAYVEKPIRLNEFSDVIKRLTDGDYLKSEEILKIA